MNKNLLLLLVLITVSVSRLNAQTQLTDFRYQTGDKGSYPAGFVQFNNLLFFEATTESEGREIWITDGSNTHILKDINPGSSGGTAPAVQSLKQSTVVLGNKLYFIANNGENGYQIWSTEGTEQSTKRVTNLSGLNTSTLTLVNNTIFFLTKENNLLQVWKSDGTSEGTVLVKKDLPIWNAPSFEGSFINLFFFTFQPEGSNNVMLWRSDGTDEGTFPITKELDGNGAGFNGTSSLTQYIVFNNELYFVVRDFSKFNYPTTVGIMKTDGTRENTVPVKAVHEGSTRLINYADVIQTNNKLYFSFFEHEYNRFFIWESDGTYAGTKKIYDKSSSNFFIPSNLISQGSNLVFTGKGSNQGTALLKLELKNYTVKEIKVLADTSVKPGYFSWYDKFVIYELANNNFLLFEPYYSGGRVWRSDFSEAYTVLVNKLKNIEEADVLGENIYFRNYTEEEGAELWKTDLSLMNPRQIANISKSKHGLDNYGSAILNDKLFFNANDGINGTEVWVYNNTTHEKTLLKDIIAGNNAAYINNKFITVNNRLFFTAYNTDFTINIWQSDGTEKGTVKLKNPNEDNSFTSIQYLTENKGKLYFVATLKNNTQILCAIEGESVIKIKDIDENVDNNDVWITNMVSVNNYIFFTTVGAESYLWKSDGTAQGTTRIMFFNRTSNLTAVNDRLYFSATQEPQGEYELWQSDGTHVGTKMVKDIGDGYSSYPEQLVGFNGQLIFSAFTKEAGREYWKTDGTAEGTIQIGDINKGPANSTYNILSSFNSGYTPIPTDYAIVSNYLYFAANDGVHGTELWRTDGTPSGTVMVSDINQGLVGSFPKNLTANNGKVYFSAYSSTSGTELWVTEGVASATRQLFDLNNGISSSTPSNFTFIEDKLFFIAEKNNSGRQLWSYSEDNVTGINEPNENKEFVLYPNPASDFLFIQKGNKKCSIKLFNLQGKEYLVDKNQSEKIYVGNLPAGVYLLVAEIDNSLITRKFIKK